MIVFGKGLYSEVVVGYLVETLGHGARIQVVDDSDFGDIAWSNDRAFYVAIGYSNRSYPRREVYERLLAMDLVPVTYVHKQASVMAQSMGRHNFVMEYNTIQPYCRVGDNNVFWCHNHIGHHGRIGSHNFFASGITVSGSCEIGDHNFFGSGVTVGNEVKIGSGCIIGAGVLVMKDIPDNSLVVRRAEPVSKTPAERVRL